MLVTGVERDAFTRTAVMIEGSLGALWFEKVPRSNRRSRPRVIVRGPAHPQAATLTGERTKGQSLDTEFILRSLI